MRYSFLTICVSIIFTLNLPAQNVPGYLGKKFTIQYGGFVFPSLVNPNGTDHRIMNKTGLDHILETSINYQHLFIVQRVVSKNMTILGSVGYNNTYFSMEDVAIDKPFKTNNGADYFYYDYDENPRLTAMHLNVGFRYFTQHLAPVGKYVEVRIGMGRVSCDSFSYDVKEEFVGPRNTVTNTYTVAGGSMWRPSLAFGFGNTRVIKDVLYLTYGFDINLFTGGIGYNKWVSNTNESVDIMYGSNSYEPYVLEKYDPIEPDNPDNQKRYVKMAAGRYGMQCALNFHIALGLVL